MSYFYDHKKGDIKVTKGTWEGGDTTKHLFLCILRGSDNITVSNNKNTSNKPSVRLNYNSTVFPLRLVNTYLSMSKIGKGYFYFFYLLLYNVTCLSSHI